MPGEAFSGTAETKWKGPVIARQEIRSGELWCGTWMMHLSELKSPPCNEECTIGRVLYHYCTATRAVMENEDRGSQWRPRAEGPEGAIGCRGLHFPLPPKGSKYSNDIPEDYTHFQRKSFPFVRRNCSVFMGKKPS